MTKIIDRRVCIAEIRRLSEKLSAREAELVLVFLRHLLGVPEEDKP